MPIMKKTIEKSKQKNNERNENKVSQIQNYCCEDCGRKSPVLFTDAPSCKTCQERWKLLYKDKWNDCKNLAEREKVYTFAFDFDNTWTIHPVKRFAESLREDGHLVIVVTARQETKENLQILREHVPKGFGIYFTSGESKLSLIERMGIKVDVWIDDDPKTLVNGR